MKTITTSPIKTRLAVLFAAMCLSVPTLASGQRDESRFELESYDLERRQCRDYATPRWVAVTILELRIPVFDDDGVVEDEYWVNDLLRGEIILDRCQILTISTPPGAGFRDRGPPEAAGRITFFPFRMPGNDHSGYRSPFTAKDDPDVVLPEVVAFVLESPKSICAALADCAVAEARPAR